MYGTNSLPNYDAWLERPYQEAYARSEREEAIIEELGLTEEEAATFDFDAHIADAEGDWLYEQYLDSLEDDPIDW